MFVCMRAGDIKCRLGWGIIKVCCNQAEPGHGYSGGFLWIMIKGISVQDESGNFYSFSHLEELCSTYWIEWAKKN